MPDLLPARSVQDRSDQLGPLPVREVAPVSEVPRDQGRRAARRLLHRDVVVELDAQDVDVGQAVGHRVGPAPGVGQVAHADGPGPPPRDALDPEPEGRRRRAAPGSARPGSRTGPGTAGRRNIGPGRAFRAPGSPRRRRGRRDATRGSRARSPASPCVCRVDDSTWSPWVWVRTTAAIRDQSEPDALQPLVDGPGSQPDVDQQPRPSLVADQRGVASGSASQHGELKRHLRFHLDPGDLPRDSIRLQDLPSLGDTRPGQQDGPRASGAIGQRKEEKEHPRRYRVVYHGMIPRGPGRAGMIPGRGEVDGEAALDAGGDEGRGA